MSRRESSRPEPSRPARRLVTGILVGVCALAVLPACGKRTDDSDRLREAIAHTRRLAASFDYTDRRLDRTYNVQGLVQDDFRFKSRVFIDDQPAFDQVVSDDVLAMRLLDPERIADLINPEAGAPTQETEIKGVSVVQALRSRRWVQDPSGAPVVSGLGQTEAKLGIDPALDAVTVLEYAQAALLQSLGARRWDPDSLSPTYSRTEDPFEEPKEGEVRYDLARPGLPSPSSAQSGAGGQIAVPATKHFRKMALYVKGNEVVRIEERIEVTGKGLRDFANWFDLFLRESKNTTARNELKKATERTPEDKLGPMLLSLLSEGLKGFGEQPILIRSMSLRLEDLGSDVQINLPEEQLLQGDLSSLVTSGAAKRAKSTKGSPASTGGTGDTGASTTTTTTAA
jgi:hypothetical protein